MKPNKTLIITSSWKFLFLTTALTFSLQTGVFGQKTDGEGEGLPPKYWRLDGNADANAGSFIGPTGAFDFTIKTGGQPRVQIADGTGGLRVFPGPAGTTESRATLVVTEPNAPFLSFFNFGSFSGYTFRGAGTALTFGSSSTILTYNTTGEVQVGNYPLASGYKLFVEKGILTDKIRVGNYATPDGYKLFVEQGILTDKIRIGECSTPSGYKLFVEQGILTERVKVALKNSASWADYVFHPEYKLMPLPQLESYILQHKHLPEIPSAEEVVDQGGFDVTEMTTKLLAKVEELTLYVIDLKKENEALKKEVAELSKSTDKK